MAEAAWTRHAWATATPTAGDIDLEEEVAAPALPDDGQSDSTIIEDPHMEDERRRAKRKRKRHELDYEAELTCYICKEGNMKYTLCKRHVQAYYALKRDAAKRLEGNGDGDGGSWRMPHEVTLLMHRRTPWANEVYKALVAKYAETCSGLTGSLGTTRRRRPKFNWDEFFRSRNIIGGDSACPVSESVSDAPGAGTCTVHRFECHS